MILCIVANWFQTFASLRYSPYMTLDISIFIFSLSAYSLFDCFSRYSPQTRHRLIGCILAFWLSIEIILCINFPWISPYDQPEAKVQNIQNDLDPNINYKKNELN